MTDLQELILRARYIFSGAPKRYYVFNLVNGKNSSKEIAKKTGRSLSSVLQDIEKLKDLELIKEKQIKNKSIRKDDSAVFEKNPLIKHVSESYYRDIADTTKLLKKNITKEVKKNIITSIHVSTENEILDICKEGENQLYEFKAPGVKMEDISEEIAAFLHTRNGGIIFYGVDDDGTIIGSNIKRQDFDQRIQNSIRNTINPPPHINLKERDILGCKIILVIIPPWDRKSLYQYTKKERYLIRKGGNKFALSPDELKKLTKGEYVA